MYEWMNEWMNEWTHKIISYQEVNIVPLQAFFLMKGIATFVYNIFVLCSTKRIWAKRILSWYFQASFTLILACAGWRPPVPNTSTVKMTDTKYTLYLFKNIEIIVPFFYITACIN